ncbi:hypothetical protein QM027_08760 [Campylobacter concisus]
MHITDSFCGSLERFKIEVNAKNGVYFGDLIDHKLHQVSENGQMNLKIDTNNSELKRNTRPFTIFAKVARVVSFQTSMTR